MFDYFFHIYFSVFALFTKRFIVVDVKSQKLSLYQFGYLVCQFDVSTALNGTGEVLDSYKTPRGWFVVRHLYGDDVSLDTVFKGRKVVGRLPSFEDDKDHILARIVRLGGLQFHNANTFSRYIYIHGAKKSNMDKKKPLSLGCVRMYCEDIVQLYGFLSQGCMVYIVDNANPLKFQPCFFVT